MLLLPLSLQPLLKNRAGCEGTGRRFQNRSHGKCPEMTRRGGGPHDSTQVSHPGFYEGCVYTSHLCSYGFDAIQGKPVS